MDYVHVRSLVDVAHFAQIKTGLLLPIAMESYHHCYDS